MRQLDDAKSSNLDESGNAGRRARDKRSPFDAKVRAIVRNKPGAAANQAQRQIGLSRTALSEQEHTGGGRGTESRTGARQQHACRMDVDRRAQPRTSGSSTMNRAPP